MPPVSPEGMPPARRPRREARRIKGIWISSMTGYRSCMPRPISNIRIKGNQLYNQLGLLQGLDESLYGRYRDDVADNQWQTSFDYQKDRDKVADSRWQTSFDYQRIGMPFRQPMAAELLIINRTGTILPTASGGRALTIKKKETIADDQWQKNYEQQTTAASRSSGPPPQR